MIVGGGHVLRGCLHSSLSFPGGKDEDLSRKFPFIIAMISPSIFLCTTHCEYIRVTTFPFLHSCWNTSSFSSTFHRSDLLAFMSHGLPVTLTCWNSITLRFHASCKAEIKIPSRFFILVGISPHSYSIFIVLC